MREANVVTEVTTVQFPSKVKPGTMAVIYNLQMANGERIGAGFKPPPCQAGDQVEYDVTMKGSYKNADNIVVVGQGVSAPAQQVIQQPVQQAVQQAIPPAEVAGAVPPASTFVPQAPPATLPVPAPVTQAAPNRSLDQRQVSIIYQSSVDKALKFLDLMLQHDCIVLGAAKGKKADICKAWVDDYADTFYRQIEAVTLNGGVEDREEDQMPAEVPEEA